MIRWIAATMLVGFGAIGSVTFAQTNEGTAPATEPETEARDQEARALFAAGNVFFEDGQFEDARGYFRRAHQLSGRPALLYNIGLAEERLLNHRAALEAYEQYLVQLPNASNAREVQSRIRLLRGFVQVEEERAARERAAEEERLREEEERREREALEAEARANGAPTPDVSPQAAAQSSENAGPSNGLSDQAEPSSDKVWKKWWFWTAAGTAVVAAVVVTALLAGGGGGLAPLPDDNDGVATTLTRAPR